MVMARRQTLVQLTDDLVVILDAIAVKRGITRSALIRSVLESFVGREDESEKDRRMIEGYTRIPPDTEDEWGPLTPWAEDAARRLVTQETWDRDDT
jgi:metal-responsive CopG/Arc/MetJ family transcriptional regulator